MRGGRCGPMFLRDPVSLLLLQGTCHPSHVASGERQLQMTRTEFISPEQKLTGKILSGFSLLSQGSVMGPGTQGSRSTVRDPLIDRGQKGQPLYRVKRGIRLRGSFFWGGIFNSGETFWDPGYLEVLCRLQRVVCRPFKRGLLHMG